MNLHEETSLSAGAVTDDDEFTTDIRHLLEAEAALYRFR